MVNSRDSNSIDLSALLKCRVCWKVALSAFIAILVVETIVLIPSYRNYAIDWQKSRTSEVLSSLQAAIALSGSMAGKPQTLSNAIQSIEANTRIVGWRIVSSGSEPASIEVGEHPVMKPKLGGIEGLISSFVFDDHMDISLSPQLLNVPYVIELRLDTADLQPALTAFVGRIAGLVGLISLFVTIVVMLVLKKLILNPVLKLRNRLTEVSKDLENSEAYVLKSHRKDEIGDVIKSFNAMLGNTANNIRTILNKEEALKQAHDNLEVKVRERTLSLSREIEVREQAEVQLRKNESHLYQLANFDDLTGLPNRLLALEQLNAAMKNAHNKNCLGALMFIDLDNFKDINDTLGHDRGDILLKQSARRLSHAIRETAGPDGSTVADDKRAKNALRDNVSKDFLARIGGDEFMVILPEISKKEDAILVASRIRDAASESFDLNGNKVFLTASIGITLFPLDSIRPNELMIYADTALYAAKADGRNTFLFFTPEMNNLSVERIKIESYLRTALENNEFQLHFQPVFNIETEQIVGMEALLRWTNPVLGSVSPEQFIPIAEGSGLILSIGEWVLKEACRRTRELAELGYVLRIAVNVSARQFRDSHFFDLVKSHIERYKLLPDQLELEITETLLVDDQSRTSIVFDQLSQLGVRLSIDDFGTGYSGLSYLRHFSVHTLKIDRSFIAGICEYKKDASLTRTIIDMAHNFDLEIIAEGVETREQLDFLNNYDCDQVQGYLLGKPMPYNELLKAVEQQYIENNTL